MSKYEGVTLGAGVRLSMGTPMLLVTTRVDIFKLSANVYCVPMIQQLYVLGTWYWVKQKWLEFTFHPMHIPCFTEEA